jgi:hypothetical protein
MTRHAIPIRSEGDSAANGAAAPASIALPRLVGGRSAVAALSMPATVCLAGWVAFGLTIACGGIALFVHVWFAPAARRWLAFPFAGIPATPGEAARIFIHNLRALGAVGSLLLLAQSMHWNADGAGPRSAHRMVRGLGEIVLGAAVTANLVVVGASLGAYGAQMAQAALPHGPVEVCAYSLALALYRQGRDRPLPPRRAAAVLAVSVLSLAIAAMLETYVNV